MKIKKIIISLVVIIAVILGFIKINNEPNKDAEIKIGLISILSGDYSAIGESFANGVKLAQEEYALKNPSKKIQLIIEDDGFEAIKGVSAYKKLTEVNNVDAVINLSSPTIGSIYDEVIEDGIPLIQTGEQPVKPTADNVYQVMPYSVISANALGAELNKSYSADEVALVYMNEPTYKTFADAFVEGFGSKIKNVYITKNDNNDFKTEALKISNSNSKIIVFYVTETETAFLIKEMKKFGNESKYAFGLVTETLDKYKEVVGDTNILNGTIVPVFKSNTDQEFVNK
jgi:ABC-type branched-subunit amino acid transport system substrate-binding protein